MKSGLYVKGRKGLSELEPVLQQWINIHQEFTDKCIDEAAYYYREETNTALISAASWRAGLPSIVEFQQTKGSKRSKYRFTGRADMLIVGNKNRYIFESKKKEIDISVDTEYDQQEIINNANYIITNTMEMAKKDAEQTQKGSELKGVGIGIFPIKINYKEEIDAEEILEVLISGLEKNKLCDAAAWCFPDGYEYIEKDGVSYPGIIITLNSV